METLFNKVGFIKEYKLEYMEFYRPYFQNQEELENFFVQVFKNDDLDKTPRRMMNQIQRFVSLANDIEVIRPKRDSLRILFLRTCIESLCKLANPNNITKEQEDKKYFWSRYLDDEAKEYILDNFVFSWLEPRYEMDEQARVQFDGKDYYSLTIDDFGMIIFHIRNMAVHEGDYWSMQLFSRDNENGYVTEIETDKEMIGCYKAEKRKIIMYHFETTLNYEKFICYFVRGCINYLQHYVNCK